MRRGGREGRKEGGYEGEKKKRKKRDRIVIGKRDELRDEVGLHRIREEALRQMLGISKLRAILQERRTP